MCGSLQFTSAAHESRPSNGVRYDKIQARSSRSDPYRGDKSLNTGRLLARTCRERNCNQDVQSNHDSGNRSSRSKNCVSIQNVTPSAGQKQPEEAQELKRGADDLRARAIAREGFVTLQADAYKKLGSMALQPLPCGFVLSRCRRISLPYWI